MDDLISRQAAIDEIRERIHANGYTNVALVSELNRSIGYIMRLPGVQIDKKGEWLRMSKLSEKEDDRYMCSSCGNIVHHRSWLQLYQFNAWCGRCGSNNRIR